MGVYTTLAGEHEEGERRLVTEPVRKLVLRPLVCVDKSHFHSPSQHSGTSEWMRVEGVEVSNWGDATRVLLPSARSRETHTLALQWQQ